MTLVEQTLARRRELLFRQISSEPATGKLLVRSRPVDDPSPEGVAAAAQKIAVFEIRTRG